MINGGFLCALFQQVKITFNFLIENEHDINYSRDLLADDPTIKLEIKGDKVITLIMSVGMMFHLEDNINYIWNLYDEMSMKIYIMIHIC